MMKLGMGVTSSFPYVSVLISAPHHDTITYNKRQQVLELSGFWVVLAYYRDIK